MIALAPGIDESESRGPETDTPTLLSARLSQQLHRQPDLLPHGCRVLVALSGGPDSTALVHLLARLAVEFEWDVEAAHFDHGLRPEASREAGLLVRHMEEFGVPLHLGRSERRLPAVHDQLRRARYDWLEELADGIGADRIATGHHQDDQVETVLFRILRGTGNRGLSGIPARRGRIVRPLLGFSALEIRGYVTTGGLPSFDDASNRDSKWARNRIRHRLLPALETVWPGDVSQSVLAIQRAAESVDSAVNRLARAALLEAAVEGPGVLDRNSLLAWPDGLRAEMLRHVARARQVRLTRRAATTAAMDLPRLRSGQGMDLGGGLRLERTFNRLVLSEGPRGPVERAELSIEEAQVGESLISFGSRRYAVRWGSEVPPSRGAARVALSLRPDHYPLKVRPWEAGDRIRLSAGSRKLKRVFGEARVPAAVRHSIPIVTDREGNVLWVAGVARCSEPTMATNKELVIEIEDA